VRRSLDRSSNGNFGSWNGWRNHLPREWRHGLHGQTLYDQTAGNNCSGVCDITQATITGRPTIATNCLGTLPCLTVNGIQGLYSAGNMTTTAQPFSVSWAAQRTSVLTFADVYASGTTIQLGFNTAANGVLTCAGSIVATTATDNVFHWCNRS
jgi:hypothetical protein